MTSQSFFDRFTSPRRSSFLPLYNAPQRLPSDYDLDELDPRPDDRLLDHNQSRDRSQSSELRREPRVASPELWNERASSVGSASKLKARPPRAMFAGPPPPIASSVVFRNNKGGRRQSASGSARSSSHKNTEGSVIFGRQAALGQPSPDSSWRLLRRQEKAIESEVQHLLDLQATGLIAGLGGQPPMGSDLDEHSDTGSSTPTGTFYSTATSKSRMINSLHIPTRANADGNVIPVRQPKKTKPAGLRAARSGLRRSMLALVNLKAEEDAHIDDALAKRKYALTQLERLSSRRSKANKELHALENSEEEPLGLTLRDLGAQYDSLTQEIHALEEKLVGMRNRRRVVRAQMDDVRSQREAGLSGFRGALRDVENDVAAMMRQPPIQPLDPEMIAGVTVADSSEEEQLNISGGIDFLRMIPERRTVEMARSWWETEIAALERRKAQIDSEHRALEEGSVLWLEVMALVTDFESRLRVALKAILGKPSPDDETSSDNKGKGKALSQEEVLREQLPLLENSISALERHMRTAESKGWNLLICAIGAELEAFREAHELLHGAIEDDEGQFHPSLVDDTPRQKPDSERTSSDIRAEESDENEVPDDLLVSRFEQDKPKVDSMTCDDVSAGEGSVLGRVDSSDNDVPAEFFAEHDNLGS